MSDPATGKGMGPRLLRGLACLALSGLVNWFAVTNFVSTTGTNTITDYGTTHSNQVSRTFYRAVTP